MTWSEISQAAVRNFACPYCGIFIDEPCVTVAGNRARYTHCARTRPLQDLYLAGYEDGQMDVLDSALETPEWFAHRLENRRRERATERNAR